jgi:hypothetical protein
MRKTLPLLATLMLAAGGLTLANVASVSAAVETPEGETLYTLADVQAMNEEMNAMLAENCGEDMMTCGRDFYDNKTYTEPKYKALDYYLNSNILISSVTPSAGELKIFYNNVGGMMRWYGPTTREMISLHLAWSDLTPEETSRFFAYTPDLSQLDSVSEWYHFIYSSASGANDTNIIPMAETTIKSLTPDMSGLVTAKGIQFTTQEVNGGLSSGWFFIDSCFSSPYYREGAECRLMFTDNYRTKFVPYYNGVVGWDAPEEEPVSEPSEPSEPTGGDGVGDASDSASASDGASDGGESENTRIIYVTTSSSSRDESSVASTTKYYPVVAYAEQRTETPASGEDKTNANTKTDDDSGVAAKKDDNNAAGTNGDFSVPKSGQEACKVEYPWWFIALVLGIDAVIMFIVWPKTRREKNEG